MKKIKLGIPIGVLSFIIGIVVLIAGGPSALRDGSLFLYTALFIPLMITSLWTLLSEKVKDSESSEYVKKIGKLESEVVNLKERVRKLEENKK
jgi:hypothetical protein